MEVFVKERARDFPEVEDEVLEEAVDVEELAAEFEDAAEDEALAGDDEVPL